MHTSIPLEVYFNTHAYSCQQNKHTFKCETDALYYTKMCWLCMGSRSSYSHMDSPADSIQSAGLFLLLPRDSFTLYGPSPFIIVSAAKSVLSNGRNFIL